MRTYKQLLSTLITRRNEGGGACAPKNWTLRPSGTSAEANGKKKKNMGLPIRFFVITEYILHAS